VPNMGKPKTSKQQQKLSAAEEASRRYVDLLFKALTDVGLYKSHASARPRCNFALNFKADEKLHSDLILSVAIDVCARAPSKKRVVCRLYELLEDLDQDAKEPILGDDRIPREWLLQLIERLSKQCDHSEDEHNSESDPWMGLHLVSDCYDELPMFALGSRELQELTVGAKEESTQRCCDAIDEALTDKHFVNKYGLTVATDILMAHKRDGDKLMQRKANYVDEIWAKTVKNELYALGVNANQPQDEQEEVHMLDVRD
jgi:hypothetical protein